MAEQLDQVKRWVSDAQKNLQDSFTFKGARQKASQYLDQLKDKAKSAMSSSKAEAAESPKRVTSQTTVTVKRSPKKGPARKRSSIKY